MNGDATEHPALLKTLINAIPDLVFFKDRNGVYLGCNRAFEQYCGKSEKHLAGLTDRDVFGPGLADFYRANDRKAMELRAPSSNEEWIDYPDGRRVLLETVKAPFYDEAGEPAGIIGISRDITARRSAEHDLRQREEWLRAIIDNFPFPVWLKDTEGRVLAANAALSSLHGFGSPAELIGRTNHELFSREQADAYHADDLAVMERCEQVTLEEKLEQADGTHWYETFKTPILGSAGAVTGTAGFTRDITGRRRADEERQRLQAEMLQTQKYESLGVLAGGIAHDFNNLLTGILGNADIVLSDIATDSAMRPRLEAIIAAAQRAAGLANQMLAFSGKAAFAKQPTDLGRIIEEMSTLFEASVPPGTNIRYAIARGLPPIEADPAQIAQVVVNLVTNACDALDTGERTISIRTGTARRSREELVRRAPGQPELPEGNYVHLEVEDSGSGVAPEVADRVFEPFVTTKPGGRGMGLAAVLGIVNGHGGVIQMETEPGRGTCFRILFPVSAPVVPEESEPEPEPAGVETEWTGSGTILLVDDEEIIVAVGQIILERAGFRVLTAGDGREAVEQFKRHADEIGCVVLDLTMPRMDGRQAFHEIRAIKPDVPVIICSGYTHNEIEKRFAGDMPPGFVQKPYQVSDLMAQIRAAIEG